MNVESSQTEVLIVLGTRPEIIKMAPIIWECERRKVPYKVVHSGQHYDYVMDKKIFEDLGITEPAYNLNVGSQPYRKHIGYITSRLMEVFIKERPNIIFVQGDTITVLAGALAANKLGIKVGHHEAGLRSHDTTMIEETNRVITDHISDFLFAPTLESLRNLHEEGIPGENVFLTGNTLVDVISELKERFQNDAILAKAGLEKKKYFLVTVHRAENVDSKLRFIKIMNGLSILARKYNLPIVYPMHPRSRKRLEEFGIVPAESVKLMDPVGFIDFCTLEKNAKLILTDSGGVQEEACVLNIPCVTLRDTTERNESVYAGINTLAGVEEDAIVNAVDKMLAKEILVWPELYGDGNAAQKILDIYLNNKQRNPKMDTFHKKQHQQ